MLPTAGVVQGFSLADNLGMSIPPDGNIELPLGHAKELEAEAAKLNLTVPAYLRYLRDRKGSGVTPERFDRMVNEIFGRYGTTMRNLAK